MTHIWDLRKGLNSEIFVNSSLICPYGNGAQVFSRTCDHKYRSTGELFRDSQNGCIYDAYLSGPFRFVPCSLVPLNSSRHAKIFGSNLGA